MFEGVFGSFSEEALEAAMQLLRSYIRCNGSITAMAGDLFIHKNTVQYRLRKLFETTGLDVHSVSDMTWLHLLYKIYQIGQSNPAPF